MKKRLTHINVIIVLILLCIPSCKIGVGSHLFRDGANIWRVIQITSKRNDSSNYFYKFNKYGSYEELYCENNKLKQINSNSDVKNFRKWELTNDSVIKIAYIPFKILYLNDSMGCFLNIKKIQDTLRLKNCTFFSCCL